MFVYKERRSMINRRRWGWVHGSRL